MSFNSDWTVQSHSCTCPRGQYICHHIGCLLLFARENISVTDQQCSWSAIKTTDEAKRVKDIYPGKEHRSTSRDLSKEEIEKFRQTLRLSEGAVGFSWLLSGEPASNEQVLTIPDVESLLFSNEYLSSSNKDAYLDEKLKVSTECIKDIAQLTEGQSENPLWLLARKNRLTASNFGTILAACRRNRFPPSLFKRISGR